MRIYIYIKRERERKRRRIICRHFFLAPLAPIEHPICPAPAGLIDIFFSFSHAWEFLWYNTTTQKWEWSEMNLTNNDHDDPNDLKLAAAAIMHYKKMQSGKIDPPHLSNLETWKAHTGLEARHVPMRGSAAAMTQAAVGKGFSVAKEPSACKGDRGLIPLGKRKPQRKKHDPKAPLPCSVLYHTQYINEVDRSPFFWHVVCASNTRVDNIYIVVLKTRHVCDLVRNNPFKDKSAWRPSSF